MENNVPTTHIPSSHSTPGQGSRHSSPSFHHISDALTPSDDQMDQDMSQSGSDVDAEGSEDAEYTHIPSAPIARDITIDPPTPESSSSNGQNGKRKLGVDEQDFIRQDPELYGLRRSVRSPIEIHSVILTNASILGSRSH